MELHPLSGHGHDPSSRPVASLPGFADRSVLESRVDAASGAGRPFGAERPVGLVRVSGPGDRAAELADRLRSAVRPGDTVAELGAGCFAVLCDRLGEPDDLLTIAHRVEQQLTGVPPLDPRLDVALVDHAGREPARIVGDDRPGRRAEDPEDLPSGTWVRFDEALRDRATRREQTEAALRRSSDGRDLVLHYQPERDLVTGRTAGVEALLRWERDGVTVGPDRFVPLAEHTGLIVPIGEWVLRTAIHQLADWARVFGDKGRLTMAVNVSVGQLRSDRIVELLREEVAAAGIDPTRLTVEITESMVVTEDRAVVERLRAISDLGVRLAIDDFGTGYASIANLRRLPIDVLKIDRQFVAEADVPGENLLGPIVQIGNAFGLTTVAEGIETVAQLERLRELGYQLGQGYLFAPPVAARSAREMLLQQYGGDETQSSADRRRDQRSARTASSPWVPGW